MQNKTDLGRSLISLFMILVLLLSNPFSALAQSQQTKSYVLDSSTPVVLRVTEEFDSKDKANTGIIPAIVDNDVYSADGTTILIPAGTPANIEFYTEDNGSWGKAGKLCMTYATTKTIDKKNVALRLSSCKKGYSNAGGVIALSVFFFPIGLVSGFIKGTMPTIPSGTTFNTVTTQDLTCEIVSK